VYFADVPKMSGNIWVYKLYVTFLWSLGVVDKMVGLPVDVASTARSDKFSRPTMSQGQI